MINIHEERLNTRVLLGETLESEYLNTFRIFYKFEHGKPK